MCKQIVALAICIVVLICLAVYVDSGDNVPGGWVPSPVGSGWCSAHGIPGLPDGFRTHCQEG